jgi:hypothetical protein
MPDNYRSVTPRSLSLDTLYVPEDNPEFQQMRQDPDYYKKLGSAALDASILLPPVGGAVAEGVNLARQGYNAARAATPAGESIMYGAGRAIRDADIGKDLQVGASNFARDYLPEWLNPQWVKGGRNAQGQIRGYRQEFSLPQKATAAGAATAIAAPYVASMGSSNGPANAQSGRPVLPPDPVDGFTLQPGVENIRANPVIPSQAPARMPATAAAPAARPAAPAANQPSVAELWQIYNQTGNPADFVRASNAMKMQRATGGAVDRAQKIAGEKAVPTHQGIINMAVGGRTDHIPMNVLANSYVLPADIVSGLGEGNTLAGSKILDQMFGTGPMGIKIPTDRASPRFPAGKVIETPPYAQRAAGGRTAQHKVVPIIAAGGEYVIHPDVVTKLGQGNPDAGHDYLDNFVRYVRAHTAKTLNNLPGPKRD